MPKNVYGSAHPCRAPFICLDITPGHECARGRKEKTIVKLGLSARAGFGGLYADT